MSVSSASLLFCAWLIGELLRDRTFLSQTLFYLPSPLVAGGLLVLSVLVAMIRRRSLALLLVLALPPIAMTLLVENRWSRDSPGLSTEHTYRLLHWNINGNVDIEPQHGQQLLDARADLYLFSESGRSKLIRDLKETLGGDWNAQHVEPMYVVDKEALWGDEVLVKNHWLRARLARWKSGEQTLLLMFVDVLSDPAVHRAPTLEGLNQLIRHYQPDLVIGDFNAPRRSLALMNLPNGYRHAYDEVGVGWSYTFQPVRLLPPLFAIDQCLLGPRIEAVEYQLPPFEGSDHRPQVLTFRVRPKTASGSD